MTSLQVTYLERCRRLQREEAHRWSQYWFPLARHFRVGECLIQLLGIWRLNLYSIPDSACEGLGNIYAQKLSEMYHQAGFLIDNHWRKWCQAFSFGCAIMTDDFIRDACPVFNLKGGCGITPNITGVIHKDAWNIAEHKIWSICAVRWMSICILIQGIPRFVWRFRWNIRLSIAESDGKPMLVR